MGELRTRVADAIRKAASLQTYWVPGPVVSAVYAEAVIRDLGLRPRSVKCANGQIVRCYQTRWEIVDE